MNIPKFTAQASLYRTSRHYRMTATFDDTYGTMYPAFSITDFVKISPDFLDPIVSVNLSITDFVKISPDFLDPIVSLNPRVCCRNCLASFPCADESCRRQRLSFCTHECDAYHIGGCACPPGRTVCEGQCCGEGEVCTTDGCCSPNQACNNRCCGYGEKCTPVGCCLWDSVVCGGRCCPPGTKCCPGGICCPAGTQCCGGGYCAHGRKCCQNKWCCSQGTTCASDGCHGPPSGKQTIRTRPLPGPCE
jgi:hypothetical protein